MAWRITAEAQDDVGTRFMRCRYLEAMLVAVICCLAGCNLKREPNMKKEPRLIDHKDEYGEYRDRVREGVLKELGVQGQGDPIASRNQMIGWWDSSVNPSLEQQPPETDFVYHLRADGSCLVKTIVGERSFEEVGQWRLNDDGTFSFIFIDPPDPSVPGLENGGGEENRRFLLGLPDGRRVLWNGDGSHRELLSPRETQ